MTTDGPSLPQRDELQEAVVGEVIHDPGSPPESGWFILGEDGYFDVDNAAWCEFQDGDAPWTSEHFELLGTIPALAARRDDLAERVARVEALADEWEFLGDEDSFDPADPAGYAADLRAALTSDRAATEGES